MANWYQRDQLSSSRRPEFDSRPGQNIHPSEKDDHSWKIRSVKTIGIHSALLKSKVIDDH